MKEFMRQLYYRNVEARFYISKGTGLMVVELTKDGFVQRKSIDLSILMGSNVAMETVLMKYLDEFLEGLEDAKRAQADDVRR